MLRPSEEREIESIFEDSETVKKFEEICGIEDAESTARATEMSAQKAALFQAHIRNDAHRASQRSFVHEFSLRDIVFLVLILLAISLCVGVGAFWSGAIFMNNYVNELKKTLYM